MELTDFIEVRNGRIFYIDLSAEALPAIEIIVEAMPEMARMITEEIPPVVPAIVEIDAIDSGFHFLLGTLCACKVTEDDTLVMANTSLFWVPPPEGVFGIPDPTKESPESWNGRRRDSLVALA